MAVTLKHDIFAALLQRPRGVVSPSVHKHEQRLTSTLCNKDLPYLSISMLRIFATPFYHEVHTIYQHSSFQCHVHYEEASVLNLLGFYTIFSLPVIFCITLSFHV